MMAMAEGLIEFKSRNDSTRPKDKGKGGGEEKKYSSTKWFNLES